MLLSQRSSLRAGEKTSFFPMRGGSWWRAWRLEGAATGLRLGELVENAVDEAARIIGAEFFREIDGLVDDDVW